MLTVFACLDESGTSNSLDTLRIGKLVLLEAASMLVGSASASVGSVDDGLTTNEEERVVQACTDKSTDDGSDDRAPDPVLVSEREDCITIIRIGFRE